VLKVSGADGKEMAAMADSGSASSAQAPESVLRDLILVCGLFASCQYGAELGDVATRNKVFREERGGAPRCHPIEKNVSTAMQLLRRRIREAHSLAGIDVVIAVAEYGVTGSDRTAGALVASHSVLFTVDRERQ
jgi:hypothetical protein